MPMEKIKEHLERLGDTPFISRNTIIDADPNIFISIKELNALRRETVQELQEKRMESSRTGTTQMASRSRHLMSKLSRSS